MQRAIVAELYCFYKGFRRKVGAWRKGRESVLPSFLRFDGFTLNRGGIVSICFDFSLLFDES